MGQHIPAGSEQMRAHRRVQSKRKRRLLLELAAPDLLKVARSIEDPAILGPQILAMARAAIKKAGQD